MWGGEGAEGENFSLCEHVDVFYLLITLVDLQNCFYTFAISFLSYVGIIYLLLKTTIDDIKNIEKYSFHT
jgi:hypothetical protein